jgi:hypothetical protein
LDLKDPVGVLLEWKENVCKYGCALSGQETQNYSGLFPLDVSGL